ncbi:MAG: 5'-nucleotidase, lipoprotein e(P4) family [Planctomycetes bacterium]|nr:5'-nucleotidase, lipoprotein e(P4) family [Planctomycetota bacterium]
MNTRFASPLALLTVTFLGALATRADRPAPTAFPQDPADPATVAVAWCEQSAERIALCRQCYAAATGMLDVALNDQQWTAAFEQLTVTDWIYLPPAIVVDIDETVLDNTPFNARLAAAGHGFDPQMWSGWVEERSAAAIPGALDFLTHAAARGVTIFYVTNRDAAEEPATRDNLRRLGFPLADTEQLDVVLTRGEHDDTTGSDNTSSDKTVRRTRIAATHRVLMLFGDDLGDFLGNVRPTASLRNGDTPEVVRTKGLALADERRARTLDLASYWGTRWFVLPNPMYGSWLDTWKASRT